MLFESSRVFSKTQEEMWICGYLMKMSFISNLCFFNLPNFLKHRENLEAHFLKSSPTFLRDRGTKYGSSTKISKISILAV